MAITDRLRLWVLAYSGGTVPEFHRSSLSLDAQES